MLGKTGDETVQPGGKSVSLFSVTSEVRDLLT